MFGHDRARSRWARSDRFSLSMAGAQAETAYRDAVVASRAEAGRSSYDAARDEWAHAFSLEPDDGVYLGELRGRPSTLSDVVDALDLCGKSRQEALEALARLVDAGLVVVAERA